MRDSVKTSQIDAADRAAMDEHVARIASSGDEQREPDFVDMLLTLSRRKKTILQVTIAAAVLAAIVSLLLPKMYTATATILPPEQKQSSANLLLGPDRTFGRDWLVVTLDSRIPMTCSLLC